MKHHCAHGLPRGSLSDYRNGVIAAIIIRLMGKNEKKTTLERSTTFDK
jgi:hypothetical protein